MAREGQTRLHHVGRAVARGLGLRPRQIRLLDQNPVPPVWPSRLRVGELAYDSVALASLALAVIGRDRGVTAADDRPIRPDAARVQASFGSEKLLRIDGAAPSVWASLSGFWEVRDGWVRTHGNYPHHARRLARLLGIPVDAGRGDIAQALRRWSRFDLEQRAADVDALAVAVRDASEWRRHPQHPWVARRGVVHVSSHGDAPPRPWPAAGALPLSGVRVLDLTRVIAGPVATRDLAVAGADVLRVDSPRLPEPRWQHLDTGHEKRTALLDLEDRTDLATLHGLLSDADVVVLGYRPSALAAYGLDAASLIRRLPGIVVARLSAWGETGPWGGRRGFDSLVQAASGIAVLEGTDEGAPGALPVQALDHSAGHFLAAAIATAIRTQRLDGGSIEIGISLAGIADELLAAGAPAAATPIGGPSPLPTESVAVRATGDAEPTTVLCAPPVLDLPGAPRTYRSPLHEWGTDAPVWAS